MADSIEPIKNTADEEANLGLQIDLQEENNPSQPLTPVDDASDVELSEDDRRDQSKEKVAPATVSPKQYTTNLNTHLTTSLSHHDRGKTVASVHGIFEKGEQPKTDKYEIWGWYCYDFANSPFSGVVVSLLLPLLLTDLAEEYGCSQTKYGCDINANDLETNQQIQVSVGVWELKSASYAAAMISLASLIQAFVYLFVGPLADFGNYRTLLFRITSVATGVCTCLYVFYGDKSLWQFVGWWSVIATVCLGLSVIFYNSWLPMLVETHEDVISACKQGIDKQELKKIVTQKTDRLALVGFSCGYCAGIIVLIICLGILLVEPQGFIYDETVLYGAVTNVNVFADSEIGNFEELYARKVTEINVYHSMASADGFVYIQGLQFVYDGFVGDMLGNVNDTQNSDTFAVDSGVDEIIVFTETLNEHICGFGFHVSGEESNVYLNVGNVTDINSESDIISVYRISEEGMLFGGISGNIGQLDGDIGTDIGSLNAIAAISLLFVRSDGNIFNTLYERIGILINGLWFIVFTCVSIKYLKHRPGPPLPEGEHLLIFGAKHTINTLLKVKQFPTLFWYLLAYFLFSDGIGTLISCGVLFGRELVGMTNSQLAIMILEVYVVGITGGAIFLKIENKYNIPSKKMLVMHLVCLAILPIWGLIGIIPSSPVGFKAISEIYIWTFFMAIHIASLQSFARSVFAQLSPVGHESEMFALFEITDKGSSWMGPLVIAIVSDVADMRWAVFYIFLFFVIPLPIIWKLDMDKGRFEAGRSMHQITKRASLLFDQKSINELQNDLKDIVNEARGIPEEDNETQKDFVDENGKTTSQALEMAIDKNLTITDEIFEEEK